MVFLTITLQHFKESNKMLKNKILFFYLFKYIFLYIFILIKTNDYSLIHVNNIKDLGDLFYYLLLLLFLPVTNFLIFAVPIYYIFKIKNIVYFTILFLILFLLEYFIYVFFTSQHHIDINGLFNALFGLIIFGVIFFKKIKSIVNN